MNRFPSDQPYRRARIAPLACLLVAVAAVSAAAQDLDVLLRAEFPVDLSPVPPVQAFGGVPDPAYRPAMPQGDASVALLEEARWTFSGVVWGFDFSYTPSDRARAIEERFQTSPRGALAWGDPGLKVSSLRIDGSVLYATVAWSPDAFARAELAAWSGADYVSFQGRGVAPAIVGVSDELVDGRLVPGKALARRAAILDAAREALRAYLRTIERSKPREVRGYFSFAAPPRLIQASGSYTATVRLRIRVGEVISYGGY